MNQNIFYLDCYFGEKKEKNIGFVKLEEKEIFFMLRGIPVQGSFACKAYMIDDSGEKREITDMTITNGYGQVKSQWPKGTTRADCCAIFIPLSSKRYGRCIMRPIKHMEHTNNKESVQSEYKKSVSREEIEEDKETISCMEADKWTQLCKTYPQVHIFPEADTVVIKPKDMVILTRKYHELALNSFVLHAYYNYRQLLLFRYHVKDKDEMTYYLGVPGIYYEREKRIAMMFGFEGFENGEARMKDEKERKMYVGCFGYYMKQVDI